MCDLRIESFLSISIEAMIGANEKRRKHFAIHQFC